MTSPTYLPEEFTARLRSLELDFLIEALAEGKPEVSVRLNAAKGVTPQMLPFATDGRVGWCDTGFYLPERPLFTADPLFHQGGYYVQEASSMIHNYIVGYLCRDLDAPVRLLDACAAPGGKTTAAIAALPGDALVVANEIIPQRAAVLRENIIKWSHPASIVTRSDTASFRRLRDSFDIVMADVPCSGEGMMRKEAEAVAQWSPSLVEECAERQREIVENLWPALRPGGYFIYSTCTFNRSENEAIVERIIADFGAESIEIPVEESWGIAPGIDTSAHCLRFFPGRVRGEGLFVAVLRKPGSLQSSPRPRRNKKAPARAEATRRLLQQAARFIDPAHRDEMTIYADADRIMAFPEAHFEALRLISRECEVIHEGVPLATLKGRDLIPSHSLALSPLRDPDSFPLAALGRDDALAYLSGEAPRLPDSTPRGFTLLTYGGLPLGFAKNLGNRANNLYPSPWRIRLKNINSTQ